MSKTHQFDIVNLVWAGGGLAVVWLKPFRNALGHYRMCSPCYEHMRRHVRDRGYKILESRIPRTKDGVIHVYDPKSPVGKFLDQLRDKPGMVELLHNHDPWRGLFGDDYANDAIKEFKRPPSFGSLGVCSEGN